MVDLREIINYIQENKLHDLEMKFKDIETTSEYGFDCHIVDSDVYFIIAQKNSTNDCSNFIRNVEGESEDNCWLEKLHTLTEDEEIDHNSIEELKLETVMNLESNVFIGTIDDFFNNSLKFEYFNLIDVYVNKNILYIDIIKSNF